MLMFDRMECLIICIFSFIFLSCLFLPRSLSTFRSLICLEWILDDEFAGAGRIGNLLLCEVETTFINLLLSINDNLFMVQHTPKKVKMKNCDKYEEQKKNKTSYHLHTLVPPISNQRHYANKCFCIALGDATNCTANNEFSKCFSLIDLHASHRRHCLLMSTKLRHHYCC